MAEEKAAYAAVQIHKTATHVHVGASVLKRGGTSSIEVYQFVDNDQFSNLDSFLLQIGPCVLYLSEELEDKKAEGRKIQNLVQERDIELVFVKKAFFRRGDDIASALKHVLFENPSILTVYEVELSVGLSCLTCLVQSQSLDGCGEVFKLNKGSLDAYMRLDSAAAEAVNLLPKSDHPSQYGSLFGVLNRCKTKSGARLLERWLRQPLLDHVEIAKRQDIVELLLKSGMIRCQLVDGPLKGIPDLDRLVLKMAGKKAGLKEIVALWSFSTVLPKITRLCQELVDNGGGVLVDSFREKILEPLDSLTAQFETYQRLVEHVVDLRRLPDLVVDSQHDPELSELAKEIQELETSAEEILDVARSTWASSADIKLERHSMYGFVLRSTRGEDERQFQQHKKNVVILSIKKNGVYCSTPDLQSISSQLQEFERQYELKQERVVMKALDTALTYLPLVEATAAVVSVLDVLSSFSTVAALAPEVYSRPLVHEMGTMGVYAKGARHPCVELMDSVHFMANDYSLLREESFFQIITGPNMGGKSTYIRGIGSIVVMAQVGSFVPCEAAELSVIDCILARVGAGDAVQKGVSTFMAEMLEASVILETATSNSLIIIDELGRGTSTFDGFGIARAISEYIITEKKCVCLFATHFHDLVSLEHQFKGVVNRHVTVHIDDKNQVI